MSTPRIARAIAKQRRLCVGLISGTSVDAVEAALCEVAGTGASVKLELVAHVAVPIEPALAARVLAADRAAELCELGFLLGGRFADAALEVIRHAGRSPEEVDVIGSHGQTVAHRPPSLAPPPAVASTLQIGEASVIAERTGIPTVSDFRTRDVAAGGEGAPLVPYLDWVMFRKPGARRALQNLGGIGNVSVVGDRLEDTIAFDTGPGNMVLDAIARRISGGALRCDVDGRLARQGRVIPELLAELLRHPFLDARPPKSAGREAFGDVFVEPLWARFRERPYDLTATAAELTVEATARAYERWVLPGGALDGAFVSGGGSRNPVLMEGLRRRLAPVRVEVLDALGFPEAAKEAACFALLASEHLSGTPTSIPSATGARRSAILGKLTP
ncbi:MAG TPA: anhydro-N-acetylmuramic acid kinase [Myxococcaceae bacterium]